MTPEQIAEHRRLDAAATPGPWTVFYGWCSQADEYGNQELIVAMRNDHLAMLDEIERLRKELSDAYAEGEKTRTNLQKSIQLANAAAEKHRVIAEGFCGDVERLRKIVDALPKTADGVPITPGMKVYPLHPIEDGFDGKNDYATVSLRITDHMSGEELDEGQWLPSGIYSSREAADAAKGGAS